MGKPHVLAIPYPAQGHVIPLLELVQCLAKCGFKVTFVNTEFNHKRVMNAMSEKNSRVGDHIDLVSIPDGLEPWEDRDELAKLSEAILEVMPGKLEELIEKINGSDDSNKIRCVIADGSMGWAVGVADKMGLRAAVYWPASAALLALIFSTSKLIHDGIINNEGIPAKTQMVQLLTNMPTISTEHLVWSCIGDLTSQKTLFGLIAQNSKFVERAEWLFCNSAYKLEPASFTLFPNFLPIGPLLASNRLATSAGNFWPEDTTCLQWLDQHPLSSVIYVAFGSFTVFDQALLQELALGLELTNRPFLWVVRPCDHKNNYVYPTGFRDRVAARGRIVGWAPQQQLLSHPSVACFLSHYGWNSILEGISNGLPFLCWPYFADQFLNQTYVCDVWKVGLGLNGDPGGIIKQEEIVHKVDQLLGDQTFRARALDLKEMAADSVKQNGCSHNNFSNFVEWMKA